MNVTVNTGPESTVSGIDVVPTAASVPVLLPLWGELVKHVTIQCSDTPLVLLEHVHVTFTSYSSDANARKALVLNLADIHASHVNTEKGAALRCMQYTYPSFVPPIRPRGPVGNHTTP
jgi:hypothetical protein|eukprot:7384786-Prymnesium_polylepis.4